MSATATVSNNEAPYKNLRVYNTIMGLLHLVQGVFMFAISNATALPITTAYLTFQRGHVPPIFTVNETWGSLRIGPAVALFLLLSAVAHFIIATVGYDWYVKNLKKQINYLRWLEYALSSSVMIVVIAMLVGVYDLSTLILIFTLNATMNLFGLLMELHNQTTKTTNWTSFIFGCIAGIVPWVVIAMNFWGAVGQYADAIPSFVYAILASIFLFFNIFPINMFLQYKKVGPWKDYLFGERVYVLLSLVAKTALAWQIWSGTLRPM
jgi:Heliorhodopsin